MTTRRHAPEPRPTEERRTRVFRIASLDQPARHLTRARLEPEEPFPFFAGQFVRVGFDGLSARDLSIASKPGERLLEFPIRDVPRPGESFFERVRAGMQARVEGPFGSGYLREEHAGPMLLVAGGSGIAPVKSIAETALAKGMRQAIHLYFGVRDESDLYLGPHFEALARGHANFNFVPVLSHSESGKHRRGMVGEAAAGDFAALGGFKAYVFGPPAMVRATSRAFHERGIGPHDIHADEPAD
jgi:CDP-4-dehydro-6-deoxyglucose reductase/ferredoxin-NAD(P)+ reductase (naphthalene dioxygenase ferredoxin-specific)